AKFGHYPPDNANLATMTEPVDPNKYDLYTQVNPLYYELGGGSNNVDNNGKPIPPSQNSTGNFLAFDGSSFSQTELGNAFGLQGILNADQEMQVVYRAPANAHLGYPAWMV